MANNIDPVNITRLGHYILNCKNADKPYVLRKTDQCFVSTKIMKLLANFWNCINVNLPWFLQ